MENLEKHLNDICEKDSDGTYDEYNERQISQEIVLPILYNLGWKITDAKEVYPEFMTSWKSRIDYALFLQNKIKVLIEVKRNGIELDEKVEQQLRKYVFASAEKNDENIVSILSNGFVWKFYIYNESNASIDLVAEVFIEQNTCESAIKTLRNFLSRENVMNGEAIKNLRQLKKSQSEVNYDEIIEEGWSYLFSNDFLQKEIIKLTNYEILQKNGFSVNEKELKLFIDKKLQPIIPTVIPPKTKFKGNLRVIQQKGNKVTISTYKGRLNYKNMIEAVTEFVTDVSINYPDILEKYYVSIENTKNKYMYITKSEYESKPPNKRISANGWWIYVTNAHSQTVKHIWEPLCKLLGKECKFDEK